MNRKFDPSKQKPERSVRLMHVSSGGTNTGRVSNRWGKTEKRTLSYTTTKKSSSLKK